MHLDSRQRISGIIPHPCPSETFFRRKTEREQSALEFREELLSLLEEADGANIGCDDLVCMMLQIGLSDGQLRRDLGAI